MITPPPAAEQFIDWDKLHTYVGRAVLGKHVPLTSQEVAEYLAYASKQLANAADVLANVK